MSTFDFSTLVTDRTSADVTAVSALIPKIENGTATEAEIAVYNAAAMKGGYNYTDMNRVGQAVQYLAEVLHGYGYAAAVSVKTDWEEGSSPTKSERAQYLANVLTVYSALLTDPALPETMEKLDTDGANQIEQALAAVQSAVQRMELTWFFCAEVFCGEV